MRFWSAGRIAARVRQLSGGLLACAIFAAACASSGEDSEPETSVPTQSTVPESPADDVVAVEADAMLASLDEALGGTQSVQDFAVIVDMRRYDGDGSASFYSDVLDVAEAGKEPSVELTGGFSFAAVAGLEAKAVDEEGELLESISIDYGLLSADAETMEFPLAVADYLARQTGAEVDLSEPVVGLLVEITTADYSRSRTHVQLGDRSELDISFVESVAPGDDLEVVHLFGQTYPGDAAAEEGLGPHELFVQRWREGRVRFLGEELGPFVNYDRTVEAIEGSTVLSRDQKLAVLRARQARAAVTLGELRLRGERDRGYDVRVNVGRADEPYWLLLGDGSDGDDTADGDDGADGGDSGEGSDGVDTADGDDGAGGGDTGEYSGAVQVIDLPALRRLEDGPTDAAVSTVSFQRLPLLLGILRGSYECLATAADFNKANRAGGYPIEKLTPFERSLIGVELADEPAGEDDPAESVGEESEQTEDAGPPEPDDGPELGCNDPDPIGEFPDPPPKVAMGWGDIHITTFDGTYFANQAAGEFVLIESPAMQVRTEPFEDRASVSTATAFAADLDGGRVSLHLDGETWVDDELIEPPRGEVIAVGGGELLNWGNGWVLRWPDGTLVRVDRNAFSLVVVVEAAFTRASGLFGDGDGDPTNDIVSRSGERLDVDADEDFERFYTEYIGSWRISAEESLFHYEAGESTDTFAIEGFPAEPVTADSLPFEIAQTAETQCRLLGVRDGPPLDACVVDVGATGEIAFAADAFLAQTAADFAAAAPDPVDVPAGTPGDTVLTIGGETLVFGNDPPNQRPQGIQASWDCQITDGDLFADGSIDLADGPRYSLTVRYLAVDSRLTLKLETPNEEGLPRNYAWVETAAPHFADAVDTLTIDGERLTARGELYVNETLESLGISATLPDGATFDPFTLDLDCGS